MGFRSQTLANLGIRNRGRQREEGATMVEAAIFGSVFIFLLMSAVWGGIYFGDNVSVQWATRSGARAGAVGGADAFSDYDVLRAVRSATAIFPDGDIKTIVIYHAGAFKEPPSDTCLSGVPVTGRGVGDCNVYTAADFKRPSTDFGAGGWLGDDHYLPTSRSVNGYNGTDYLGVYVRAECTCGSLLGGSVNVTASTVMRLEAREI